MKLFLDLVYSIPRPIRIAIEIVIGVTLILAVKS